MQLSSIAHHEKGPRRKIEPNIAPQKQKYCVVDIKRENAKNKSFIVVELRKIVIIKIEWKKNPSSAGVQSGIVLI